MHSQLMSGVTGDQIYCDTEYDKMAIEGEWMDGWMNPRKDKFIDKLWFLIKCITALRIKDIFNTNFKLLIPKILEKDWEILRDNFCRVTPAETCSDSNERWIHLQNCYQIICSNDNRPASQSSCLYFTAVPLIKKVLVQK